MSALKFPRRLTGRAGFLKQVRAHCEYWASQEGMTKKDAVEGVAFSILSQLDGCCLATGGYEVRPLLRDGSKGSDIAGGLHENFFVKKGARAK